MSDNASGPTLTDEYLIVAVGHEVTKRVPPAMRPTAFS